MFFCLSDCRVKAATYVENSLVSPFKSKTLKLQSVKPAHRQYSITLKEHFYAKLCLFFCRTRSLLTPQRFEGATVKYITKIMDQNGNDDYFTQYLLFRNHTDINDLLQFVLLITVCLNLLLHETTLNYPCLVSKQTKKKGGGVCQCFLTFWV